MATGYIYCISNDINNHKYVGKTIQSIEKRFQEHQREANQNRAKNRPLYYAINKYGIEHFKIEQLEEVEVSLLEEREQYWIEKLNTFTDGYNATIGGDGRLKYDYEAMANDYLQGMLIKEIAIKYGCDDRTVTIALQASSINGKINAINRRKHKINQLDKNGNFIQSFNSQSEAAKWLILQGSKSGEKALISNIGRVIHGKRKTCEGYIWQYAN